MAIELVRYYNKKRGERLGGGGSIWIGIFVCI